MEQLAIKGHATRGKEVIEILKMLGGKNVNEVKGCGTESSYYIDKKGIIDFSLFNTKTSKEGWMILTIEQFLEKFPYKVGDKVKAWINGYCGIHIIKEMQWDSIPNEIKYRIGDYWYNALSLQPYKEETMEETKKDLDWHPTDYLEFVDNDDTWADEVELNLGNSYEIVMKDGKIFAIKKKPQYSKTYEECCEYLMGKTNFQDFELVLTKLSITTNYEHEISPEPPHIKLINVFYKLLICRDAYWKIAGEEMRLGKPWEPSYKKWDEYVDGGKLDKHTIIYDNNEVQRAMTGGTSFILTFPTEEMRDAFYENFKDLIEECKELL